MNIDLFLSCPGFEDNRLFGVLMTLGLMFGAVSPYVAGALHDLTGGYPPVYLIIGLTGLIGAAMTFMIPKRGPAVKKREKT